MVKKEKTQIRNIKNEKVNNRCYSVKRIESLCCPPETITVLLIGYPSIWNPFPCGSAGKESTCNTEDLASIPGLERSPGKGKGYPLHCSGLENSMDCVVDGVAKSRTQPSDFHFHYKIVKKKTMWVDKVPIQPHFTRPCLQSPRAFTTPLLWASPRQSWTWSQGQMDRSHRGKAD